MTITELQTGLVATLEDEAAASWRGTRHPGISWRLLHQEDGSSADATVLIRMEPGSSYPEHEHQGVEEVLILAGGYRDGDGEHRAGSYLRYSPGSRHAPVALGEAGAAISALNPACVLFAVAHGGVRLVEVLSG